MSLGVGTQVPAALRDGQGVQHRPDHGGALGSEISADHPRPVERGVQGQAAVQVFVVLIVRVRRAMR
jgi:hypothetical protein